MIYRTYGKLGWKTSILGFGAMRLPTIDNQMDKIDKPLAKRMIRYAIDNGVNYVDTAYPYHMGQSEVLVGEALKDGYRDKVKLVTKMPLMFMQKKEEMDKYLNEQLGRLKEDHVDVYVLHGLMKPIWDRLKTWDVFEWAEKTIASGKIGNLGFSFHDDFPVFKEILDSYDKWAMCQMQYNYMDINYQAGTKGLKYAAGKGIAVVIMEPIRGGQLARPPASIKAILDKSGVKRPGAAWALQWVWNHPEVTLTLSGMSAMEQVVENVALANQPGADHLTEAELQIIDEVRKSYEKLVPVLCTKCGYCQPCPNGVAIPRIFEMYNDGMIYNAPENPRMGYNHFFQPAMQADNCKGCDECLEKCPQHLPIPDLLKKAHEYLKV
ncbi:MAG: aldo/keto reductase [Chloroflexi bacterium RBG_16_48_7]|nr:MAG: aldo/keto reductase [Chloroflexi bacterium RBG_16_48_7]